MARKLVTVGIIVLILSFTVLSCKTSLLESGETIGDTVVEIQCNLLDYLDDSQKVITYGENPRIPGQVGSTTINSPVKTLDISDEIGRVKAIESVNIFIDYELDNLAGTANLKYVVYLSAVDEDPFSVPGIESTTLELRPGAVTQGGLTIAADARLRELFAQKSFQYAATLKFESNGGSEDIIGEARVTDFRADIVFTI